MWYFTLCWGAVINGVKNFLLDNLASALGKVFLVKMVDKSKKTKSSVTLSLVWSAEKYWIEAAFDLLYIS